jgi:predicted nucleic acid-binding protein
VDPLHSRRHRTRVHRSLGGETQLKLLVFNSTPLIYLTKIGLSTLLENLEEKKLTTPTVKREVVDEGKRKNIPDATVINKLIENGYIEICGPKDKKFLSALQETRGLHLADAEVLVLAREREGLAVIDDEVARKTAKIYGINYVGSPYILMRAVHEKIITKERAKQALNNMISVGWRCSIESYTKITDALEKL